MGATTATDIHLRSLGATERAALDRLLREFRFRGWRDDDDAAGAIVGALVRGGGAAPRRAVLSAVPHDFLDRNGIKRADVARLLARIGG